MSLARNLRKARLKAGINRETLAARSEVSLSTIARYEAGAAWPTVRKLQAIARALGVETHELLTDLSEERA